MQAREFKIGDRIRAEDFEPRPGRGDCFVEGVIIYTMHGGNAIAIQCTRDVFDGVEKTDRIGHQVHTATQMMFGDWESRLQLLEGAP